ncbi:Phospholipase YtpA [compost metagenome]
MNEELVGLETKDGTQLCIYNWSPSSEVQPKAVVQIAHGMAENAGRYRRLAAVLTKKGYIVYANDHRGHGQTAGTVDQAGIFPKDSFNLMCSDMAQISGYIRDKHEALPIYLMGHSMGSFLTQQYMYQYPNLVNGFILSGSNGKSNPMLAVGAAVASTEARFRGETYRSKLLNQLSFGSYNKLFQPNRTEFDWLSRDNDEVDAYIADPYCGALFTAGFYRDFLKGLQRIHNPENMRLIPKDIPVYIFSGDKDPVGAMGKGITALVDKYHSLGLTQVTSKLYAGGRHEMLNETNRDEVMKDLLDWLDARI